MDQQTTLAPSALRYALRALVLLGGALVWWLFLSGGSAQASDDAPEPMVSHVTQTVTEPLHHLGRVSDGVDDALRKTPARTSDALVETTKPVPAQVGTTVEALVGTAEPVLTATTSAVADTLDRSVRSAQPVVDHAVDVVLPHHAAPGTSSAPVHTTAARVQPTPQHTTRSAIVPDDATRVGSLTPRAVPAFRSTAASAATVPVQDPQRGSVPSVPASPTAPVGGSSPTGVLAGLALVPAIVRLRRRSHADVELPVSPAYPPGTSPG